MEHSIVIGEPSPNKKEGEIMAWRPTEFLTEGELDNTTPGKVTGWLRFAGMNEKVTFDLEGNFHRDIRGAKIRFKRDAITNEQDAETYMEGFTQHQTGKVGDITAGLPPQDYTDYPYVEWFDPGNGRVVIELEPDQIEVVGMPIPAIESDPISREQQKENMKDYMESLAHELHIPAENAICMNSKSLGQVAEQVRKHTGMKLLPQDIRKQLPPLNAQEDKGPQAVAYLKLFTPDANFTWWITEGSPITDDNGNEVDYHFFGLVQGQCKELGYISLRELEGVRGPMGLPNERDLHWQPKTLAEIAPELFDSINPNG